MVAPSNVLQRSGSGDQQPCGLAAVAWASVPGATARVARPGPGKIRQFFLDPQVDLSLSGGMLGLEVALLHSGTPGCSWGCCWGSGPPEQSRKLSISGGGGSLLQRNLPWPGTAEELDPTHAGGSFTNLRSLKELLTASGGLYTVPLPVMLLFMLFLSP